MLSFAVYALSWWDHTSSLQLCSCSVKSEHFDTNSSCEHHFEATADVF
jgi:hypothetical protein